MTHFIEISYRPISVELRTIMQCNNTCDSISDKFTCHNIRLISFVMLMYFIHTNEVSHNQILQTQHYEKEEKDWFLL